MFFLFTRFCLPGVLALLLTLTVACAKQSTQPRTTEQSQGHGPGSGALRGSGDGMNQGHARADTTAGPSDPGKKRDRSTER